MQREKFFTVTETQGSRIVIDYLLPLFLYVLRKSDQRNKTNTAQPSAFVLD